VTRDPYEVLGVRYDAEHTEIRRAMKRLAAEFHPDRHGGSPEASARLREVLEAYEILKTPAARAKVDAERVRKVRKMMERFRQVSASRARPSAPPRPAATVTELVMTSALAKKLPLGGVLAMSFAGFVVDAVLFARQGAGRK
jgi:curved DNA-binding protein CbpA